MLGRTNTGGGGGGLNFKVICNPQPSTAKENTIWVNTDTHITSWLFSATEPSPAETGMVWFYVGTFSPVEFNSLKKNGIQVYPQSAKQYVGGAWVDVESKTYQGGEWVEWIFEYWLFKSGEGPAIPLTSSGFGLDATATYTNERIDLYSQEKGYRGIGHEDAIDLTPFNTIKADYVTYSTDDIQGALRVRKEKNGPDVAVLSFARTSTREEISLDISQLTGKYYVLYSVNNNDKCTHIHNVKLET